MSQLRKALQLADEAQQAREAQKRSELQVREAQGALSALRLEKSALEARCAAAEAAQADALPRAPWICERERRRPRRAPFIASRQPTTTRRLWPRPCWRAWTKFKRMATTDDSSEALQTLEKRATELETALADTQQRLNDESTARANAESAARPRRLPNVRIWRSRSRV